MDVVSLKPNMVWVIEFFLDTRIGGKKSHTIKGSRVTEHERLEWQEKIFVNHREI